jgi:hypothetical protein
LRRHIPARDLAGTCWRVWLESNRRAVTADQSARVDAILQSSSVDPLDAVARIHNLLRKKETQ